MTLTKPRGVDVLEFIVANDSPFVLPAQARLQGIIDMPFDIEVRGHVDGELRARTVHIKRGAKVFGTVIAESVLVEGNLEDGRIFANRIALLSGCCVEAELYCKDLDIAEGALFEGLTRRVIDPLSMAPPPVID
ncbi:MAG: polymer-forming cytoskeletal protein [Hyphomicrobiaceae bacterium]